MKKIFLDSNIFLRFFVPDDEEKHQDCVELIKHIDKGQISPATSPIAFLECNFVLVRQYKFPKEKVQDALGRIALLRNMTIQRDIDTQKALMFWKKTGVKLADCLIATQVKKGTVLVTYDQEFQKLPFITVMTPHEILAVLAV